MWLRAFCALSLFAYVLFHVLRTFVAFYSLVAFSHIQRELFAEESELKCESRHRWPNFTSRFGVLFSIFNAWLIMIVIDWLWLIKQMRMTEMVCVRRLIWGARDCLISSNPPTIHYYCHTRTVNHKIFYQTRICSIKRLSIRSNLFEMLSRYGRTIDILTSFHLNHYRVECRKTDKMITKQI